MFIGRSDYSYIKCAPNTFTPFVEQKYPMLKSAAFLSSRHIYTKTCSQNLYIIGGYLSDRLRHSLEFSSLRFYIGDHICFGILFAAPRDEWASMPEWQYSLKDPRSHLQLPDISKAACCLSQKKRTRERCHSIWKELMEKTWSPERHTVWCLPDQKTCFRDLRSVG